MTPPPPPVLMEELVEEILLRVPPTDPATLVRAALVCKPWRSLVSGAGFRRRFREFHRVPPMLGFFCNNYGNRRTHRGPYLSRFVSTSSFSAPAHANYRVGYRALEARHGRVLLQRRSMRTLGPRDLVVWNPVTDEMRELSNEGPVWNQCHATVLCARTGACNHLDCSGGSFVVVSLGMDYHRRSVCLCIYSSEDGSWREPTYLPSALTYDVRHVDMDPTALAGNTLYFLIDNGTRILGYNLATRETCVVQLPPMHEHNKSALITVEDGELGVAILGDAARLSLWSMEVSPNGDMGWAKFKVTELDKLLSVDPHCIYHGFVGFAHGIGVFIVKARVIGYLVFT